MNQSSRFPPTLEALLFSVFDPQQGPIILHQVPETTGRSEIKLDYDYVIPKASLCGKLTSFPVAGGYKIMGLPVTIEDGRYDRNAFIFNLLFLFKEAQDLTSYEAIIRKCARVFRDLESSTGFISKDIASEGGQSIRLILEQMLEDLNSFCECSIPLDETTWLNLKLFPQYKKPKKVHPWDVPICTANLGTLQDRNWDITLLRILPFIDGINSVKMISQKADIALLLSTQVVEHLIYYGCVLILDLFQYTNSYTVLPSIVDFGEESADLHSECSYYISRPRTDGELVSFETIYKLYSALKPSLTLTDWVVREGIDESRIDVRRMITYGIIKKFLRRVQRFLYLETDLEHLPSRSRPMFDSAGSIAIKKPLANGRRALDHFTDVSSRDFLESRPSQPRSVKERLLEYIRYEPKETDEICLEFGQSLAKLLEILGDEDGVTFIWS